MTVWVSPFPWESHLAAYLIPISEPVFVTGGYTGDLLRIMEHSIPGEAKLCMAQYLFIDRRTPVLEAQNCALLYAQLRRDILRGYLPVTEESATKLGAFCVHYDHGDYVDPPKKFLVSDYLPPKLVNSYSPADWTTKLNQAHAGLLGFSKAQCQRQYTHLCQTLPFYGCLLVEAELNFIDWKHVPDPYVAVVIHEDGLEVHNRDFSQRYMNYSYADLARWRLDGPASAVEFTIAGLTSVVSVKATPTDCMFILRHVHGYVNARLERSGFAVAQADHLPEETAENADLLRFKQGDIIRIISHNPGNGWEFGVIEERLGNYPTAIIKHATNPFGIKPNSLDVLSVKIRAVTEYVPFPLDHPHADTNELQ
jgi:hypothetical protein